MSLILHRRVAGIRWPVRRQLGVADVLQLHHLRGPDAPGDVSGADLPAVPAHVSQRGQLLPVCVRGRRHVDYPHHHHSDRRDHRHFRLHDLVSMYDQEIPIVRAGGWQ